MLWQLLAMCIVFGLAVIWPRFGHGFFRWVEKIGRVVARRRRLAVIGVGVLTLLLSVVLHKFVWMPAPGGHDEHSYLLAADTFSQGRLTNPPHPLAEHLEAQHVLQSPSYQSKYPPGQAFFMAAGMTLFGDPIWGIWLGLALATAAVCWMLQGWVSPGWALVGALLVTLNPLVLLYWGQTYLSGAPAMLGGALLYGALPRMIRRPNWTYAIVLACGLILLANTRPYEGLVASLPAAVVLGWRMIGPGRPRWTTSLMQTVVPIVLVLAPAAAAMGYYNYCVTGDPWTMPYQVWMRQRLGIEADQWLTNAARADRPDIAQGFVLPGYSPEMRQDVAEWSEGKRSDLAPLKKIEGLGWFYFAGLIPLVVPLIISAPRVLRTGRGRFAGGVCVLTMVALMMNQAGGFPHYFAPAGAMLFVAMVQALRYWRCTRWGGRRRGIVLVGGTLTASCLFAALLAKGTADFYANRPAFWTYQRQRVLQALEVAPKQDVIFVRYGPHDDWHYDFIANRANVDASAVVWVRDLGSEKNRRVFEHFRDRRFWVLEPTGADGRRQLVPLPDATQALAQKHELTTEANATGSHRSALIADRAQASRKAAP